MMENLKDKRTTIDIPQELYMRFKIACARRDSTMKDVIIYSIRKWVEKVEESQT